MVCRVPFSNTEKVLRSRFGTRCRCWSTTVACRTTSSTRFLKTNMPLSESDGAWVPLVTGGFEALVGSDGVGTPGAADGPATGAAGDCVCVPGAAGVVAPGGAV